MGSSLLGIRVNSRVTIPREELELSATRSGGPGGQHVNTSSTRIELRWVPGASRALTQEQKARVAEKLGARLDGTGAIRITSSETRSQSRNRDIAEERLAEVVRRALVLPKPRRKTKPSRASKEARLNEKRVRAKHKSNRRWSGDE